MNHRKDTLKALENLSLEQKAALLFGKSAWETRDYPDQEIPSITFSDGPAGLRKMKRDAGMMDTRAAITATAFPSPSTLANSWDPSLADKMGQALGEEADALAVDVLLGPGINLKRNPLCGRNFEYYSEDPYLTGKMAAGMIKGVQKKAGSACVKHFAVNSQETRRMAMNAVVDERALREIYLTGFEIAVEEGKPGALMTSYNEVNGEYSSENTHLIQDILRGEWGYEGLVITDWGAANDPIKGVKAGLDITMPFPGFESADQLVHACQMGEINEDKIDERAACVLDTVFALHEKREKRKLPVLTDENGDPKIDEAMLLRHRDLAGKIAAESIVLLKNEGGILPLDENKKAAVIGEFASVPRLQGEGSAFVNAFQAQNVADLMTSDSMKRWTYRQGYKRNSEADEKLEKEAIEAAKKADVVLYFFGLEESSESEGFDRKHMRIPENQIHLLEALSRTQTPVIGVLMGGAAVQMPWISFLDALVYAGLPGEAGAGAVLDVIRGKVNPSGRLAETYPLSYEDTPSAHWFDDAERDEEYRESIYVGYRYFDTVSAAVRFPFGFGLSYTDFLYSDLEVTRRSASVTVTNTGKRDGAEVVQLYVSLPDSNIFRAKKELKGFRKVFLKAGESQKVRIPFDAKTFRYFNVKTNRWEREEGTYLIQVGSSSRDIRLSSALNVAGTKAPIPYAPGDLKTYQSGRITQVSDQEYASMSGFEVKKSAAAKEKRDLNINDAMILMKDAKSPLARLAYRVLNIRRNRAIEKGSTDFAVLSSLDMPFRALAKLTGGKVGMETVDGLTGIANGHLFSGAKKAISGASRNKKLNREFEEKISPAKPEEETKDQPEEDDQPAKITQEKPQEPKEGRSEEPSEPKLEEQTNEKPEDAVKKNPESEAEKPARTPEDKLS